MVLYDLKSIVKNSIYHSTDKERIRKPADCTVRNSVGYFVDHFNPSGCFFEVMLMMPHCIWADPLLINKIPEVMNLSDLCKPICGYPWEYIDFIPDQFTRKY